MSSQRRRAEETFEHCSLVEKIRMIEMKAEGKSVLSIGQETGRHETTVRRVLNRWNTERSVDARPRSGRHRKMTELMQAKMLVYIQTHRTATLREIKLALGTTCSLRTINDYFTANQVYSFDAPLKPSQSGPSQNHRSCARKVWRMR